MHMRGICTPESLRHDFEDSLAQHSFPTGEPGDRPGVYKLTHTGVAVFRVTASALTTNQRALGLWGREQAAQRQSVLRFVQQICSPVVLQQTLCLSRDHVYASSFTAQHINRSLAELRPLGKGPGGCSTKSFVLPPPTPGGFPLMSLLPHSVPKGQHPLSLQCTLLPCHHLSEGNKKGGGREPTEVPDAGE